MQELTLKELQGEELKILKDVHDYCIKNNLRYSLYGGTLIGALRHKGFIPWDDDIDIIMPRPDYTRFCKEYKSVNYKIADLENTKGYMLGFARVYDDKTTTMKTLVPWIKCDVGVWIDVFPADGLIDDKIEIARIYRKAYLIRKLLTFARVANVKISEYDTFLGKTKLIVKKLLSLNGRTASFFVKRLDKLIKQYDFENSPMWASLSNIEKLSMRKHHSKSTFQSCNLVDFEDMKACIMNGSDEMLRERNGNYMQLPPESERVPKQWYIHYYWKK